jgi:predicted phage terminase large subunit-like protein
VSLYVPPPGAAAAAERLLWPPPDPDRDEALAFTQSLRAFIEPAWPIVEPGTVFKTNWHIDAICEHLEAVSRGDIRELIINVPPRHMKSSLIAVLWPCWEWLTRPETKWLFVSYAAGLSKRDSLKCRRIIESEGGRTADGTLLERVGYQGALRLLGQNWQLASDQNEKMRFENTEAGYRIATSVGGTATGEGGDILVVDDPHKADEVESETERRNVIDFLDGTLSTRLNDPTTGRVVVVMQRLHQQDATGHLLDQGGYTHLCLPAEYEPTHPFVWPDDPRSEPGELLWPEHFTEQAVDKLKRKLGSYRAAGQLQQRPSPAEGGMFQRDWWRYWTPGFEHTLWKGWDLVLQSWDMRFSDSQSSASSYVVGQVWGVHEAHRYLLAQIRGRLSFVETLKAVRALTTMRPEATAKLVEKKANGAAVISTLQRKIPGLIAIEPEGGKDVRAAAVSPYVEAGNILLPPDDYIPCPPGYEPTSVQDFIEEHAQFPNGANDDQVDSLSQALNWIDTRHLITGLPKAPHPDERPKPAEPPGGQWDAPPEGDTWTDDLFDFDS